MTNAEASAQLQTLIDSIANAIARLKKLSNNPGGPVDELADRRSRIAAEALGLSTQRIHAQNRKLAFDVAASANATEQVAPARVAAITAALNAVSVAIAHMNEFQQAVQLAKAAADAVSKV